MKIFENKDGFHLDLFVTHVCGKLQLSKTMVERTEFYKTWLHDSKNSKKLTRTLVEI